MIAPMELLGRARSGRAEGQEHGPSGRLGVFAWENLGTAIGLLLGWRCALWLFALLAMSTYLPTPAPTTPESFFGRTVLSGEAHWQLQLAQGGYQPDTALPAFPPLYAILMRLVAFVTPSWAWAGALVSHAALLGALTYLLALARLDDDHQTALRVGMAALLWPGAALLGTVSPDATLLLTCVAAFYHARRGQWGWAGIWAALAGLTRGTAVLVAIPLVILLVVRWRAGECASRRARAVAIGAVLAAPLAFVAFLASLWWSVGTPLAFWQAQEALGFGTLRRPIGLLTLADWRAILGNAEPLVRGYDTPFTIFRPVSILALIDALTLALAGFAGLWLVRRSRWAEGGYLLVGTIAAFAIWGLPSSSRHLLALAPLYLVFALWARRSVVAYLGAFLSLEAFAFAYYIYLNIL